MWADVVIMYEKSKKDKVNEKTVFITSCEMEKMGISLILNPNIESVSRAEDEWLAPIICHTAGCPD